MGSSESSPSMSYPEWLLKWEPILARCDDDLCERKEINNPAAWLSPAILSSQFPSIQGIWSVGGDRSNAARIVDRINRCITTMLSIISTLSLHYTTIQSIYYTLIYIACSQPLNSFVLISLRLFKSWHEGSALLLILFHPAPPRGDDLSMTRITHRFSAWYPTLTLITEMTIHNLMMSLLSNHPGNRLATGHQKIPSWQHVGHES